MSTSTSKRKKSRSRTWIIFVLGIVAVFALVIIVGLFLASGNGSVDGRTIPMYEFNAVKGHVLVGDQPVTGGTVTFLPLNDPNFTASGQIQGDGSFTLTTKMPGERRTGAPVGSYHVSISIPQSPGNQGDHGPFGIEKDITVQKGENKFTLQIPPPSKD